MASDHGLFIGWNRVRTGREGLAQKNYNAMDAFWAKQKAAGKIVSSEWVTLTPHGGNINGFLLIRGDRKAIEELAWSDEFISIMSRGEVAAEGMMVIWALVGDAAKQQIASHQTLAATI
jgi:hypothetical protein